MLNGRPRRFSYIAVCCKDLNQYVFLIILTVSVNQEWHYWPNFGPKIFINLYNQGDHAPERTWKNLKNRLGHEKSWKDMKNYKNTWKKPAKTWKVMKNRIVIRNVLQINLKTCSPKFTYIYFLIPGLKKSLGPSALASLNWQGCTILLFSIM